MKGNNMEVKRYDIDVPDGEFVEKANGRAVLYDDFACVVEERDAIRSIAELAIKSLRDEGLTTTANELTFLLTTNAEAARSKP